MRRLILGAGAMVSVAGVASGQPGIEPGGLVFIAEEIPGATNRMYFRVGGNGANTLNPFTFGADADLPPVISVDWFADRASILVGDGTSVVGLTQFGLGGAEPAGVWGTDGASMVGVSGFQEPLVGFDEPALGFGIADVGSRLALWETPFVSFDEPALGIIQDGTLLGLNMGRPYLQVRDDGLYFADAHDQFREAIPVITGLGTVIGATAFAPGSVATQPQPDIPGHAGMALLVGGPGNDVTLYGIWGTNGTAYDGIDGEAYDGIDGEAIWGTGGVAHPITANGLMLQPTSVLAFPKVESAAWSFLVSDLGVAGARGGGGGARIIGVLPDGRQAVVSEGGLLVSPMDMAMDANGMIIVADRDASGGEGGEGALIMVDPATGAQTLIEAGGAGAGWRRPLAVGVVRCGASEFVVNSSGDFVDPVPGDGDPSDGSGNVCLRSAVMEANASPCAAGAIVEVPAGVFPLGLAGTFEDGCLTGDIDVTGYVRIRGQGRGVTELSASGLDGMLDVRPGGTLVVANLTITGGVAAGGAGGVTSRGDLAMTNVEVKQHASHGVSQVGGHLVMSGCSVTQNTHSTGNGGGVLITSDAVAVIARSFVGFNGAGLNGGGISASGPATVVDVINTTITGNTARISGGGVFCNNATVTLDHCTVVNNDADTEETGSYSGGGLMQFGGTLRVANSIVARNSAGLTYPQSAEGTITTLGYNVFDATAGFTFVGDTGLVIKADPMINGAADNGGPTLTHSISSQSPALDGADPVSAQANDQRSVGRPVDGDGDSVMRSDIGAFEFVPPSCRGDVNGDGNTDVFDFTELVAKFGESVGFNQSGDLDGDGDVDVYDFTEFLIGFGCSSD